MAVTKVISLCKELVSSFATGESFTSERQSSPIRLFYVPTINVKADVYYQLANIKTCSQQPRAIAHLTKDSIKECRMKPLLLYHPCHNQIVERHIKLVTEASLQIAGFKRRDGLIRQKMKSCGLIKKFDTKMPFTCVLFKLLKTW